MYEFIRFSTFLYVYCEDLYIPCEFLRLFLTVCIISRRKDTRRVV